MGGAGTRTPGGAWQALGPARIYQGKLGRSRFPGTEGKKKEASVDQALGDK